MNRENFYDELLTQDGHSIEHVRPPRDLLGWHQLPVAALPLHPAIVLTDLGPAAVGKLLESHPYTRFPVVRDGTLAGILTRKEGEAALAARREPQLEPAAVCQPSQTIRDLQAVLINSSTNFAVVTDGTNPALSVITLHDLLRAQIEKSGD
jgi:hypothetical protein